jgi:uncharacterized protein YbaP (TraB family)
MTRLNLRLNLALVAIYLFFNACWATGLYAADTTQKPPLSTSATPAAPLLWKVEGPHPSWLFGTAHTDDPRVATLPRAVTVALDGSRSFHPELEKTGGAFVAIGAGHLVGPRSVTELLRSRGWKITRVTTP